MKILISGVCGFVGSELAIGLRRAGHAVTGFDNFSRPGSELNRPRVENAGVDFFRGDVRFEKDLGDVRGIDWVIDAAANPSVLAGIDGKTGSRELLEHNLWGTVNLLEVCKREGAGMVLLSTSRVYSIDALCALPVAEEGNAFVLRESVPAAGPLGVTEDFSTSAPISLYGASKLASEQIALEYGSAFGFPVWVNRCSKEFGPHEVASDLSPRPFDLPWVVLDSSRAEEVWDWKPRVGVLEICAGIARHAREHPEWLGVSAG